MPQHWIAIGLSLLTSALSAAEPSVNRPPNIVLIVADDLGYQDLGCFGSQVLKTPHLDRLAREGVRATNFYVTWPACTPSRGSLLTGRFPQRNGLYDMIRNDLVNYGHRFTTEEYAVSPEMTLGLDVREITIAQALKQAGYATGVVGKWDSGQARRFLPLQRGFDSFYGFANTGIDYWTHERYGIPSMFRGNQRTQESGYATHLFRREAVAFLERNHGGPFFLYLPFNAPHGASNLEKDSYQVPEEYLSLYAGEDPQVNRTKYRAMVSCLDEAIGAVLERLQSLHLNDNTFVMFLSDNGGTKVGSNGPLRGFKSQMFEGGLRVPFVARWPGRIPAGQVREDFLTALEIFPTIMNLAGVPLPKNVTYDGFDMLAVLQGKQSSGRTEMFWQRRGDRAARVGQYKWVDAATGSGVFDLSVDVGEQRDLSKERPDLAARLKNSWLDWRKEMDEAEPRGPFRDY